MGPGLKRSFGTIRLLREIKADEYFCDKYAVLIMFIPGWRNSMTKNDFMRTLCLLLAHIVFPVQFARLAASHLPSFVVGFSHYLYTRVNTSHVSDWLTENYKGENNALFPNLMTPSISNKYF
jgi:hypothetical protein